MKKRILPALLALCMVISLLPVTVFAADEKQEVKFTADVAYKCACEETDKASNHTGKDGACAGTVTVKDVALTVEVAKDAEDSVIEKAKEDKVAEEAAKGGQGLCAACKANVKCNPCKDDDCSKKGEHTADTDHSWICACKGEEDKCTSTTHDAKNESKCTGSATTKGGICDTCKLNIAANKKAEDDAKRDCAAATKDAEGNAVEAIEGTKECQNTTHQAGCPARCTVDKDCDLTEGHGGNHKNKTCLKGLPGCNPDVAEHDKQCEHYVMPADTATTKNAKDSIKVEIEVDCACETEAGEAEHTGYTVPEDAAADAKSHGKVKVKIDYYYTYSWDVVVEGKELSAAEAAAAKAEAQAKEKEKAETAAKTPTDDMKAQAAATKPICAYCKAANAAADKAAAALTKNCTMTADCKAGSNPLSHRDDCLSQCTMDSSCGNSEGVSTAHRVEYQVYKTTYEVTYGKDDEGNVTKTVTKSVSKGTEAVGEAHKSVADAQNYKIGLPANSGTPNAETGKREEYGYSIRAIHCPQAKVPDGVVVNEAGEVVANPEPTETPEKPTKAEDFTDMEDWMAEGVQFMLDKGWMEGLGDGKFGGRDDLKTTMVLTVLARMNGETITGSTWADDAKAWAEKNAEFFEGIDLTSENMARKDVVLVLWRQAGKPEPSADFELEFTDVEGLEGDHLTAMKWAVENKIVLGNGDGTVSPDGNINRSALSLLTMRADKAASK